MKNPTIAALATALELHEAGTPMKAILAETGLNYSQAWYYIRSAELRSAGLLVAATPESVQVLRADGHSWGEIAVRCQAPESKVRRLFTESTGFKSQGNRIGKGGRFYYGYSGEPMYTDGLKPTGTLIPKGAHLGEALASATDQKLIHMDMSALRTMAEDMGITVPKKPTKAGLATKIRKAQLAAAK